MADSTKNGDEILAELQEIFRDILDQPDLILTRASNASNVEDWDSLAHINLLTTIEKHFKIKFALNEIQELKDVGEMIELIQTKIGREMNEYRLGDVTVGMKHEFDAAFTAEDAAAFARISGDVNPLHVDETYAKGAGFPSPVLFGMLTSSLYSQLVGVYLPGKYVLLHGIDIDFNSPCHAGDPLHVTGEVVFVSEALKRVEIKASIRRGDRKLVSKATIRVGFHVD